MGYLFVTGATGLLGAYLVRDLLRSGRQLALLVRSSKLSSAVHRVEHLLSHWEQQTGYALPRPVVFDGHLNAPNLGLNDVDRRWVARNCDAILHNAASLTFHSESRDGEPWRSNLEGTRHVIDFSRQAGIKEFHHVSTAYVCGLRQDRVFESELDVGQRHSNDYEVSKYEAERLVRSAEFIKDLTVYRPGIIFGDSRTGYTSTYHGFYVPLKLIWTIVEKVSRLGLPEEMFREAIQAAGARLREVLQLTGREAKNYVPVDWVSATMVDILNEPALHGNTYHLTPRNRVSTELVQQVFEEVFLEHCVPSEFPVTEEFDWEEFEQFFISGMEVYRSYWRDDPIFDSKNTQSACPHRPCPELDAAMIRRMCRFAIDSNFGWPRPAVQPPAFDLHQFLEQRKPTSKVPYSNGREVRVGLQVNGRGGGQWEVTVANGRPVLAVQGLTDRCTAKFYLNSTTFSRIARAESTADQAIQTGRVVIEGNGVPAEQLSQILQELATGPLPPAASG